MKPLPRIQLIQSWQTYSKGCFLWPTAMLRNWLIATGRALLAPEPAVPGSPSIEEPRKPSAVTHPKAKRKGA